LQPQYEAQAAELGIERQVKFAGHLDDDGLARAYQNADILVLPSINSHEAFGIVLLEAMASGLPVIASNLPGVRAVFVDGIQGLICVPKNSEDLKNKIVRILTDENLQQKMGRAARELVLEKYSLEKVSDKLLRIFKA
jgi:glycosyltransferase involved in cell wall biosynthesis